MEPSKTHSSELLNFITPLTINSAPQDAHLDSFARGNDSYATVERSSSGLDIFCDLSSRVPGLQDLSSGARAATNAERKMTFGRACRVYPKAMAWSALASSTIIMEGFDLTLVNSFLASPTFQDSYGTIANPVTGHQISLAWQSGLSNAAVAGEILGLLLNGYCTDRFGFHHTIVGALIWLSLSLFIFFFSINIQMLLAAQILCGISWG
jgi:SP family general alpha glucoside:H+ symporter-like MFS transporter